MVCNQLLRQSKRKEAGDRRSYFRPCLVIFLSIALVFWSTLLQAQILDFDPAVSPRHSFYQSQSRNVFSPAEQNLAGADQVLEQLLIEQLRPDQPLPEMVQPPILPLNGRALPMDDTRPLSRLERHYNNKLKRQTNGDLLSADPLQEVQPLRQFGYDQIRTVRQSTPFIRVHPLHEGEVYASQNRPAGTIRDSYVLGVGDRLQIMFLGERTGQEDLRVSSNGQIFIEGLPPLTAAGRSLAQVQDALNAALSERYVETQGFLTVESVEEIQVLVMGEVGEPGRHLVSSQTGVMELLASAGGVKKTGSLRHIQRVRGNEIVAFDLYDFLISGMAVPDLDLRNGDRVIVPPIGPTVAVTGHVVRPAIYELSTKMLDSPSVGLDALLALGGGALSPSATRMMRYKTTANGISVDEVFAGSASVFQNGDILDVAHAESEISGHVQLQGAVTKSGRYSLTRNASLSDVLSSHNVFSQNAYMLLGAVIRQDAQIFAPRYLPFSPIAVVSGERDLTLKGQDRIVIFDQELVEAFRDKAYEQDGMHNNPISPETRRFFEDHALSVRGAVTRPGRYPVAENTALKRVLAASGGLTSRANYKRLEVTRLLPMAGAKDGALRSSISSRDFFDLSDEAKRAITVGPFDSVHVPERFQDTLAADHTVRISGEVLYPGTYNMRRGETLLDLLNRAGGLTDQAYPEGAIFSRAAERKREEDLFRQQAFEIEKALAQAMDGEEVKPEQVRFLKSTVAKLENAPVSGRITVEADPAALRSIPAINLLLEAGDHLHIPKRAITVRVAGQVMAPGVLQYRQKKTAQDYVREAGGISRNADESRAFVLLPDGSARPLRMGFWSGQEPVKIMPGSTIYIPHDPKPFELIQTTRDISQILTNVAIAGIFIDDIQDDD